jgi:ABC-2 type transport system ATP-binding protein
VALINLENVTKDFKIYKREKGVVNALKSLVSRQYETKRAVDGISFSIERGEAIGYIGANGAGKSTTLKILSGILTPTSGQVLVDGIVPYVDRKLNAMKIGVVFGQRTQLHWDLPVEDSFDLYKTMYKIDDARFKRNVDFFLELLGIEEFYRKPVRQLSLGQKMRAELAAALLHDPEILYLDEPTIGLDVLAKGRMREFIKAINRDKKTTVMITTHDMDDIEEIAGRIIMINEGRILIDSSLNAFKEKYGTKQQLVIEFFDSKTAIDDSRLKIVRENGNQKHIEFDKRDITTAEAITLIARKHDIAGISIKEKQVEDIVREIYVEGA